VFVKCERSGSKEKGTVAKSTGGGKLDRKPRSPAKMEHSNPFRRREIEQSGVTDGQGHQKESGHRKSKTPPVKNKRVSKKKG